MYSLRLATEVDRATVEQLLQTSGLATHGVLAAHTRYWLAEAEIVLGVLGLELGAEAALLRSAAVVPERRGQGLGGALVQAALNWARTNGVRRMYLFSTEAGEYWLKQGFTEVPVAEVVAALPAAPQVLYYAANHWLPDEIAYGLALQP